MKDLQELLTYNSAVYYYHYDGRRQEMESEMMNRFQQIYAMLEDDESRDVYLNRLNYLISGDFGYMKQIIDKYVSGSNNITAEEWVTSLPSEKSIILYGAGYDALMCLP